MLPFLLTSIPTIDWNMSPQTGTYNNSALSVYYKGSCINSLGWQNALIGPTTIYCAADGLLSNGRWFVESIIRPNYNWLFSVSAWRTRYGETSFFRRLASHLRMDAKRAKNYEWKRSWEDLGCHKQKGKKVGGVCCECQGKDAMADRNL